MAGPVHLVLLSSLRDSPRQRITGEELAPRSIRGPHPPSGHPAKYADHPPVRARRRRNTPRGPNAHRWPGRVGPGCTSSRRPYRRAGALCAVRRQRFRRYPSRGGCRHPHNRDLRTDRPAYVGTQREAGLGSAGRTPVLLAVYGTPRQSNMLGSTLSRHNPGR